MTFEKASAQPHRCHGAALGDDASTAAIDPVCGMTVNRLTAKYKTAWNGQDFVFCGPRCRQKFHAEPARYLAPPLPDMGAPVAAPAPADTIYTCPMHPQIRRAGPRQLPNLRDGTRAPRTDG